MQAQEAKGAAEGKETESAIIRKDIKERIPDAAEASLAAKRYPCRCV